MTKRIRWIILFALAVSLLASCSLFQRVELTISTNIPRPYTAGQVIPIKYSIKNTGSWAIAGPVTVSSDKTAVNCPPLNTIGNLNDVLDPQEVIECTADYPVNANDVALGAMVNTATANVGSIISPPVTTDVFQTGPPQLLTSLLKLTTSATPTTYGQVGQEITFNYAIQNTGTSNIGPGQFTVTDTLIGPAAFNCGPADTTLTPSASVNCTAKYIIKDTDLAAASITNVATASGGGVGPSAAASTTINRSIVTLSLATTANPTTYSQADQVINFAYVVKNTTAGNLGPAQFTVQDSLVSATPINCGPPGTTLVPNATVTCTGTYKVTPTDVTAVSITSIATAFDGGTGSSTPVNTTINKGSDTQHTVESGEWLWQIARCYGVNPRTLMADNAGKYSDPRLLKPGTVLTIRNPGSYSKYYGRPCVEKYTVKSGDSWNSIAQAYNADPEILQMVNASKTLSPGTVVVVPKNSATGNTPPTTELKALAMTTSANPTTYEQVGQAITFSYQIRNSGNVSLGPTQFTVNDTLVSATPINCGPANTILVPNATVNCTATYTIKDADMTAASITNIATASGGGVGPSTSASATVTRGIRSLSLTTTANPTTYNQAGQVITFSYTIRNSGTATLGPTQFTVSDTLVSATPINCGPANTILTPNATVNCTATYTVKDTDMTAASITNIATASGGGAGPSAGASATVTKQ